jgi:hypothetical protein
MAGRAAGSTILRMRTAGAMRSIRATSSSSERTPRTPSMVLTSTGQALTKRMMVSSMRTEKPNTRRATGTRVTGGMARITSTLAME